MFGKDNKSSGSIACETCGYEVASIGIAYCPGCGKSFVPSKGSVKSKRLGWLSVPAMLYPRSYTWFIYLSTLDVLLTWLILWLGGREVNAVADAVISSGGLSAILTYKFCLAVLVVVICEVVGRRKPRTGRNLALVSIAVTAMPVVLSIWQLFTV